MPVGIVAHHALRDAIFKSRENGVDTEAKRKVVALIQNLLARASRSTAVIWREIKIENKSESNVAAVSTFLLLLRCACLKILKKKKGGLLDFSAPGAPAFLVQRRESADGGNVSVLPRA